MSESELQDAVLGMALDSTAQDAAHFERAVTKVIGSPRYTPKKKNKPGRGEE
jgi:hypothetical protein